MRSLLKLLKLQTPDGTAFEEAHAAFDLRGDRVTVTQLDLIGAAVSLGGTGEMDFTGQFLHPLRTRIVLQRLHAFDEALLDRWGEGSKLAFSRRGEEN